MPRARKQAASVETQKKVVEKTAKNDEPDEEMDEFPPTVDDQKQMKRTISKSSTVSKNKKQKKGDAEENGDEDEEMPTETKTQKAAGKRGISKVSKNEDDEEEIATDAKVEKAPGKRGRGKPAKNGDDKEEEEEDDLAEIKAEKPTGKRGKPKITKNGEKNGSADEETKATATASKLPTPPPPSKRGKKGKDTKKVEKEVVDDGDEQAATAGQNGKQAKGKSVTPEPEEKKSAPKRGGKAKSAKQVEKLVVDEEVSSDADVEETKEKSADSNAKLVVDESISFDSDSKTKDGRKWNLKISSWNICGMRSWVKKGGLDYLKKEKPDIMIVQETRISEKDLTDEMKNVDGYHAYFQPTNETAKKGYAGVAMYTKTKPLNVTFGVGVKEHDVDGRLITAEFETFYLIGAYVPNAGRKLVRLAPRREWNKEFLEYIKRMDVKKPIVYCGDLNVAHNEIDLANPKTNTKNAGFSKEEREDFTTLLSSGFVDTYRSLYPKKTGAYTFWSNMSNSRSKNVGWRLDYFVVSERFEKNVCDNVIRSQIMGSDHCPSTLFLAL